MAKITDAEFKAYLKEIREFIESDEIEEMQRECEVTNVFPQRFFDLCNEHQLFRISLPEEYGGWGLSEHQILQVQEEFSRGPGGMRMFIHFCQDLNWRPLYDFGSDELKAELMPKFGDKTILSAWCVTEQTGGTGADLHTTAVQDPETGDWIINGEKWLISFTDVNTHSYIHAVTDPDADPDHRISTFYVPVDTPGYEVIPMPHMMGCRGAGHTGLRFTNMRIPDKYRVGEVGQGMEIMMHSLAVSRVHIAASNLGMAQRMLEISIDRARDRITFGKPIISRQAIKIKLANMQMMIHALRTLVRDFAKDYDADPMGEYIAEKASICKLFSIDTTRLVGDEMLEIFGGDGYFEDSPYGPTERLYRDSRAMWLEEGTPTVQRITIARELDKHHGVIGYRD
ncbi:MAG: acyl-CoA dehydrogenase family protein [Coriobacteriia bacterium]|nr:acyl-CoA dehydrogenase family protein [Coriobacteriia bacterium]